MALSPHSLRHLCARTAAPIQLKPGVTPVDVLKALDEFFTKRDIELHPMLDPEDIDFGFVPMSNPDDNVFLNQAGQLSFSVQFQGAIHEDLLGQVKPKLVALMASHGTVEFIVRYQSADEQIEPEFLGATQELQDAARQAYALAKAFYWLKPQIGDDGCRLITHMASGLSATRRDFRVSVAPAQIGLLQLSTIHLAKATMKALGGPPQYDATMREPKLWNLISYTHWGNDGWMIFCNEGQADTVRTEHPELARILDLGVAANAYAVLLDCDGPELPGLAAFDHAEGTA
jgi:hypothetical protein